MCDWILVYLFLAIDMTNLLDIAKEILQHHEQLKTWCEDNELPTEVRVGLIRAQAGARDLVNALKKHIEQGEQPCHQTSTSSNPSSER